jgi:hypothetical protein
LRRSLPWSLGRKATADKGKANAYKPSNMLTAYKGKRKAIEAHLKISVAAKACPAATPLKLVDEPKKPSQKKK